MEVDAADDQTPCAKSSEVLPHCTEVLLGQSWEVSWPWIDVVKLIAVDECVRHTGSTKLTRNLEGDG
jgi:hypothetical protein